MVRKKIILTLIAVLLVVSFLFPIKKSTYFNRDEMPKNIFIISQSSEMNITFVLAIDLDNNELIFFTLDWDGEYRCFRTGIKCDPNKQIQVPGKSAPFKPPTKH